MSTVVQFPIITPKPVRDGRIALRVLAQAITRTVRGGVNAWMVRRSVQEIQSLNDRALADLGLRRSEIEPAALRHKMHDWWPQ